MTCPECDAAAKNPTSAIFRSDCKRCSARLIAHGQDFWRSSKAGEMDPAYRRLLELTFGFDLPTWHAEVKAWAERIHQARQWEAMRAQQKRGAR